MGEFKPKTINDLLCYHLPIKEVAYYWNDEKYLQWAADSPAGVAVEMSLEAIKETLDVFHHSAAHYLCAATKAQVDSICTH